MIHFGCVSVLSLAFKVTFFFMIAICKNHFVFLRDREQDRERIKMMNILLAQVVLFYFFINSVYVVHQSWLIIGGHSLITLIYALVQRFLVYEVILIEYHYFPHGIGDVHFFPIVTKCRTFSFVVATVNF